MRDADQLRCKCQNQGADRGRWNGADESTSASELTKNRNYYIRYQRLFVVVAACWTLRLMCWRAHRTLTRRANMHKLINEIQLNVSSNKCWMERKTDRVDGGNNNIGICLHFSRHHRCRWRFSSMCCIFRETVFFCFSFNLYTTNTCAVRTKKHKRRVSLRIRAGINGTLAHRHTRTQREVVGDRNAVKNVQVWRKQSLDYMELHSYATDTHTYVCLCTR